MSLSNSVGKVVERYPKLGAALFVSGIQYFLVQLIVGQRFMPTYSVKLDTISDLGNTACAAFNGRMVCSPLHSLMNASFFALGFAMITGSVLIVNQFASSRSSRIGLSLFGLGGVGVILVALFPENTIPVLHGVGATLPFLVGNAGLVILSFKLNAPKILRTYTLASGTLALIALVFYSSGHFAGLGEGGIERVVAYPQTIWMVVIGAYLYLNAVRRKARHLFA